MGERVFGVNFFLALYHAGTFIASSLTVAGMARSLSD